MHPSHSTHRVSRDAHGHLQATAREPAVPADAPVATIVKALGGWMTGPTSGLCRCPAHDDLHPSLSLGLGQHGRLLANCFAGCSFIEILDALRARGLAGGAAGGSVDDSMLRRIELEREQALQQRVGQALAVWERATASPGSLAEVYARQRAFKGPLPASHRFVAQLWHRESGQHLPALVLAVTSARTGAFLGVHRIYLDPETGRKAQVREPKAALGPVGSGSVEIDGSGPALLIAEGVENAWALADVLGDMHVVRAVVSASMLGGVALPKRAEHNGRLVIAADNDDAGIKGAHRLRDRALGLGWSVRTMFPPEGSDFNAIAMTEAGHE